MSDHATNHFKVSEDLINHISPPVVSNKFLALPHFPPRHPRKRVLPFSARPSLPPPPPLGPLGFECAQHRLTPSPSVERIRRKALLGPLGQVGRRFTTLVKSLQKLIRQLDRKTLVASRVRGAGRHCFPTPGEAGETDTKFRPGRSVIRDEFQRVRHQVLFKSPF